MKNFGLQWKFKIRTQISSVVSQFCWLSEIWMPLFRSKLDCYIHKYKIVFLISKMVQTSREVALLFASVLQTIGTIAVSYTRLFWISDIHCTVFIFFPTYVLLSSLPSPSFLGLDCCNVCHLSYAAELMLRNVLACRAYFFRFVVVTLSLNCFRREFKSA